MDLDLHRMVFRCKYCGMNHVPDKAVDCITIFQESKEELNCPVCKVRLYHAKFEDFPGFSCSRCRGLLMNAKVFHDLILVLRSRTGRTLHRQIPICEDEMRRAILCPGCSRTMDAHPYLGPGSVVVDSCTHCNQIWFDFDELNTVVGAP